MFPHPTSRLHHQHAQHAPALHGPLHRQDRSSHTIFFSVAAAIVHTQMVDSDPGVCRVESVFRLRESRMD